MGIIDGLKNLFNTSGSRRRSRLGVGVAFWKDSQPWAYDTGLVPVMATFTIPHVWNDLDKLLEVLRKSWSVFFSGSRHRKRSEAVGLEGYVRRLEIN